MIARLIEILQNIGREPSAEEIADILWLAPYLDQSAQAKPRTTLETTPQRADAATDALTQEDEAPQPPHLNDKVASTEPSESEGYFPAQEGHDVISPGLKGFATRSSEVSTLPDALAIGRALRPLMRRVPSRTDFRLDEEATAQRIADEGNWIPVLRSAPSRWLDIALVIDASPSMVIWQQTIVEFRRLLERQGAFRNVQIWNFSTDPENDTVRLYAGPGLQALQNRTCSPRELIDPRGQRLVLVVSDCVSPAWYNGEVARMLVPWGQNGLVTIVQMLPQRLWVQSALGNAVPVYLQTVSPGTPNTKLKIKWPWIQFDKEPPANLAIPIVTLESRSLTSWAQSMVAIGGIAMPGVVLPTVFPDASKTIEPSAAPESEETPASLSPEELVQFFRATASPVAWRLAGYLAAAPLSLPIMRLVQQIMLPESGQVHLAEVFLSGLIKRQAANDPLAPLEEIRYDFVEGVRDLLLSTVLVSETVEVLAKISNFIDIQTGKLLDFWALIVDSTSIDRVVVQESSEPFATVAIRVLRRLGGQYARLARSLEQRFEGIHVKVSKNGFVVRQKEIQTGLRVLQGSGNKYGLLIHGPAGVGKSSLVRKLIELFPEPKKELIEIRGPVKKVDLLHKLHDMFDHKGLSSGLEIIESEMEFEEKIKALFHGPLQEQPTLIYFDSFEQNLVRRGDEYRPVEAVIEIIQPLLMALDSAEGKTNLLITSRYPFILEAEGEEHVRNLLTEMLEDISLMSFSGRDLEKMKAKFKHIAASIDSELYLALSQGNPRLLEWLEKIAAEEKKYDLKTLKQDLQGKKEEEIHEYLADIVAKTQGEDFYLFLRQAAVFRQPVKKSAFKMFGSAKLFEKGVELSLIEWEQHRGQETVYILAPVIRESEWRKLPAEQQLKMHQLAYRWYDEKVAENSEPNYNDCEEAVHHALNSDNIRGACKYAIPLGKYLDALVLYRERLHSQQQVIDLITATVVEAAITEKDGYVATLLNNQGETYYTLGEARKAIRYYEKALGINLHVYGEKHPDVTRVYDNLGQAWRALGDAHQAKEYHEKALKIDLSLHSEKNPDVTRDYNKLGIIWHLLGDAQKALEYHEKALTIDLSLHGEKHRDLARDYNELGSTWFVLGDAEKTIWHFEQALEIDRTVHSERHPRVAIRYNNLGAAWYALDDARKAIVYFEKALKIFQGSYGEKHPNVATGYNNLGKAWRALGDPHKAIGHYEKALEIFRNFYGEKHPNVATGYNNLGEAWKQLGECRQASFHYEKALEIDLNVYREKHPDLGRDYNNLGEAWRELGDAGKAIMYYDKAIKIFMTVYGNEHPSTQKVKAKLEALKK